MKLYVYSLLILGTIGIAFFTNLKRWTLKDGTVSPMAFLVGQFASASAVFALLYLWVWGARLPETLPGFWRAAAITAVANFVIQYLGAKAVSYKAGEVSLTAPLQALTPGLITVVALTIGEIPGWFGVAGIAFMICGSYILMLELRPDGSTKWAGAFRPFRVMGQVFNWNNLNTAEKEKTLVVMLSIGSAFFGTFGLLFDGLYTRRGLNMQGLAAGSFLVTTLLALFYLVWFSLQEDDRVQESKGSPYLNSRMVIGSIGSGLLWVAIVFAIYQAFLFEYVAYVGALKRLSIIMSGILGWLLFSEQNIRHRLFAAALVTIGAILLSMDDLPARISSSIEGWGL